MRKKLTCSEISITGVVLKKADSKDKELSDDSCDSEEKSVK